MLKRWEEFPRAIIIASVRLNWAVLTRAFDNGDFRAIQSPANTFVPPVDLRHKNAVHRATTFVKTTKSIRG
jgi:hypothetical protein